MSVQDRREQLAENLDAVRARIDAAAESAGRDPAELTLIAVTKTWPASDVGMLVELGAQQVGENRLDELVAKQAELAQLGAVWHFIGQIQSKKAAHVGRAADVVHGVDRVKLVPLLARGATEAGRPLDCLIQVNLDPEPVPGRGGATAADVQFIADEIGSQPSLRLRGVSGVAPRGEDPRPAFEELAEVAATLGDRLPEGQRKPWISAGMTGDFEAAIACGATHLRIGTALLGDRPLPRVA